MKKLIYIFVKMLFMNDARVLRLSSIYHKAMWGYLFNEHNSSEGFKPYVIGGYLLFLWLMVPHKQTTIKHSILKALYNKQLSPAKVVVDVF
jgi:hypothetical protein